MRSLRSLIDPGGRMLAQYLDRLRDTLDTLGTRVRDAVSSAVGETVAGVVRETVRAVLDAPPTHPSYPARLGRPPGPPRPLWTRPDTLDEEEPWFDGPDHYPPDEEDEEDPPTPRSGS